MKKVSQLPTEIWLKIASYLPKSQILQLKSLNTFFFYRAMDIDWGQITIDMKSPDQAALVLSRMADPFVASRTTRLTVCLRKHRTVFPVTSKPKLPSILLSKMVLQGSESTTQTTLMTLLLNVLPLLTNLIFFKIELLLISLDSIQDLFRAITTSPLARTIETLSLTGHPDLFTSLVECPNPETTFANLSALDFNLIDRDNDDLPTGDFNTNNILSLAHFVLSLSPSLQHLRIFSSSDVSPLFTRLSQPLHDSSSLIPLPNLKSVKLIPFNFTFRFSPQSIHRFLLVHSVNIQHLQLSMMMSCWPLPWDMDKVLDKWLSDFVKDESTTKPSPFFPNLQTLDIHPPATPAGLSATLVFIKRTAPTLSSLRIRSCDLSNEGATQVVHALVGSKVKSSKLKSLQMDISDLNVPFIELLAVKLPQLQTLRLSLKISGSTELSEKLFLMMLEDRRYHVSPDNDCLTSWKLRYLSIQGFDSVDVMAAFLPSVVLGGDDESSDEE